MGRTKAGFGEAKAYDSPDSGEWSPLPSSPDFAMGFQEGSPQDMLATPHRSVPRRILDSFKQDPNLRTTPRGVVGANGKVFDCEAAAHAIADSPLHRKLKGRHLQMIAIGGSIGMHAPAIHAPDRLDTDKIFLTRDWPLCRLGQGSAHRWTGIVVDRLYVDWRHVILHRASAG